MCARDSLVTDEHLEEFQFYEGLVKLSRVASGGAESPKVGWPAGREASSPWVEKKWKGVEQEVKAPEEEEEEEELPLRQKGRTERHQEEREEVKEHEWFEKEKEKVKVKESEKEKSRVANSS